MYSQERIVNGWGKYLTAFLLRTWNLTLLMKFKKFGKMFDFVLNLALKFEIYQLNVFAREDEGPFW